MSTDELLAKLIGSRVVELGRFFATQPGIQEVELSVLARGGVFSTSEIQCLVDHGVSSARLMFPTDNTKYVCFPIREKHTSLSVMLPPQSPIKQRATVAELAEVLPGLLSTSLDGRQLIFEIESGQSIAVLLEDEILLARSVGFKDDAIQELKRISSNYGAEWFPEEETGVIRCIRIHFPLSAPKAIASLCLEAFKRVFYLSNEAEVAWYRG
jgi:hypothetical protein